jgi:hypothetical protein
MENLEKYTINKRRYFDGNELKSSGIGQLADFKNTRQMVKALEIPESDHIFARYNKENDIWEEKDGKCMSLDKVFIKPSWVKKYIKSLEEIDEPVDKESLDEPVDEDILKAPTIITLGKREKLRDNKGKIIEIEVRGSREYNNCFFKGSDVAEAFDMKKQLWRNISRQNSVYIEGQHYRYFMVDDNSQKTVKNQKCKQVKELFLTYLGLLHALFLSKNNRVSLFLDWATKTLFTAHLGTKEDKRKLSSELMGISVNALKEVFNKTSSKLPVVYLFAIGTVGQLRVPLEIDNKYADNLIVCKGGETNDIMRRTKEHESNYGTLPGSNMGLLWYNYIDPQYVTKAETEILQIMKQMNFLMEHKQHNELIVFSSKKELIKIQDQFDMVTKKYMGHVEELQKKLTELENKIAHKDEKIADLQREHEKEMSHMKEKLADLQKDHEKELRYLKKDHKNEISLLKAEHLNEIMKKDREIEKKESCVIRLKKRIAGLKEKLRLSKGNDK